MTLVNKGSGRACQIDYSIPGVEAKLQLPPSSQIIMIGSLNHAWAHKGITPTNIMWWCLWSCRVSILTDMAAWSMAPTKTCGVGVNMLPTVHIKSREAVTQAAEGQVTTWHHSGLMLYNTYQTRQIYLLVD